MTWFEAVVVVVILAAIIVHSNATRKNSESIKLNSESIKNLAGRIEKLELDRWGRVDDHH